jgi:hypothetical protein
VRGEIGLVVGPAQVVHLACMPAVALALTRGVHDQNSVARVRRFGSDLFLLHVSVLTTRPDGTGSPYAVTRAD